MPINCFKRKSGTTMVEVLVGIGVFALVTLGATAVLINTLRSSDRTRAQSDLDASVAFAAERVAGYLCEARTATIDSDGLGLTYKYPATNGDGTYTASKTATESSNRQLYLSNGSLYASDDPNRPILTDIPSTDPETGLPITIFSAGINSREVIVRLVTRKTLAGNQTIHSAITSRVRLRNAVQS